MDFEKIYEQLWGTSEEKGRAGWRKALSFAGIHALSVSGVGVLILYGWMLVLDIQWLGQGAQVPVKYNEIGFIAVFGSLPAMLVASLFVCTLLARKMVGYIQVLVFVSCVLFGAFGIQSAVLISSPLAGPAMDWLHAAARETGAMQWMVILVRCVEASYAFALVSIPIFAISLVASRISVGLHE